MIAKPMMDWIVVNIVNQVFQMTIRFYLYSSERMFKKASRTVKPFIDGFGVCVKKIGKLLVDTVTIL
jgi:hypothetical protein